MAENRVYRVYDRAVKGYEDLAVVAEARNQIDEWRDATDPDGAQPANRDIKRCSRDESNRSTGEPSV